MAPSPSPSLSSSAPKISLSLNARKPPVPPTAAPKRPHALLDADDDGPDANAANSHAQITTFGAGAGAERPRTPPRVIPPLANREWRKRQKSAIPGRGGVQDGTEAGGADVFTADLPQVGLVVAAPAADEADGEDGVDAPAERAPLTADEEALAALKGERAVQETVIRPPTPPPTEEEAFRRDFHSAPANPTLDEYNATPVEGFGAALMRGYLKGGETLDAWRDRAAKGVKGRKVDKDGRLVVERRKDLLGLGAKEMDVDSKKGMTEREKARARREEREAQKAYMPLARRNIKTGEIVAEADFKQRLEYGRSDKAVDSPREERRAIENGHGSDKDSDRKERSNGRRYEDDEEYSRRKERDRRRERDEDDRYYEKRREKERRREGERDDYDRRREKDRRLDHDREHERDRRHREDDESYSSSSRRDHRHRDRSRERHRR